MPLSPFSTSSPSTQTLRALQAILRPTVSSPAASLPSIFNAPTSPHGQIRLTSKMTALDLLHRRQRAAIRQKKADAYARAASMPSPPPPPPSISSKLSPSSTPATDAPLAPLLPYTLSRTTTPSRSLAIYHASSGPGRTRHVTRIRRASGDLAALCADLRAALGLAESYADQEGNKKETVTVNWTTRHITVRGWRGPEVRKWAEGLGF